MAAEVANQAFADFVLSGFDPAKVRRGPSVEYSFDGREATVMFENVLFVGEYVGPNLTILRERKSNRVVGCVVGLPK